MARVNGTLTGTSFSRGPKTGFGLLVFAGQPAPDAVATTTAYSLTASPATVTATGDAATLTVARILTAATASVTATGDAAPLVLGRVLAALAAAYTVTGSQAALAVARILAASPAALTITGDAATLDYSPSTTRTLDALAGTFLVTGSSVTFVAPNIGGSAGGRGEIVDLTAVILRNDDEVAALVASLL